MLETVYQEMGIWPDDSSKLFRWIVHWDSAPRHWNRWRGFPKLAAVFRSYRLPLWIHVGRAWTPRSFFL